MMTKATLQKGVCEACGTAIRKDSAFCYNCGESVEREPPPPAILKPDPDLLNGGARSDEEARVFRDPEPPPVSIPAGSPVEPDVRGKTAVFPAAAPRRRPPRARVRKVSEVEWVEPASRSGRFIVTAVALAILAALLAAAAIYLH